jgi:tRNA (uracil-5-)-methyltransferase TRM9
VNNNNKDVFDRIAPGWYGFRHRSIFAKELETLAVRWQGGCLLNIGCAHGPDFLPFRQGFTLVGLDFSLGMLDQARRYARKFSLETNLTQADACHLPYHDASFDWAIAVATYHHLSDKEQQLSALTELKRVLKPGGEAFITVWNRCQPRFWFKPARVKVPWRTGDTTLYRDYYLFTYPELEELVKQAGFTILSSRAERTHRSPVKYFSRNICLLVKKGQGIG